MDLDAQIQMLIDHAPQDGTTPKVIQAIGPALTTLAGQLGHLEYYVLQAIEGNWIVTTLSHRIQSTLEKTVVYAFATSEDAIASAAMPPDQQVVALSVPTTHILFQLVTMKNVDSAVFFDGIGNATQGTEVSRQNLNHLIQQYLQQYQTTRNLPPDIA